MESVGSDSAEKGLGRSKAAEQIHGLPDLHTSEGRQYVLEQRGTFLPETLVHVIRHLSADGNASTEIIRACERSLLSPNEHSPPAEHAQDLQRTLDGFAKRRFWVDTVGDSYTWEDFVQDFLVEVLVPRTRSADPKYEYWEINFFSELSLRLRDFADEIMGRRSKRGIIGRLKRVIGQDKAKVTFEGELEDRHWSVDRDFIDLLHRESTQTVVEAAIRRLPPHPRRALTLHLADYPVGGDHPATPAPRFASTVRRRASIASIEDVSRVTVYNRINRAYELLRADPEFMAALNALRAEPLDHPLGDEPEGEG